MKALIECICVYVDIILDIFFDDTSEAYILIANKAQNPIFEDL